MAKAPTEEQSQLRRRARRRLVGSIALVTIVAVILPWVLEDEPGPADQQIAIQIPSPDAGKFEPKAPPSKSLPAAPEPAAPAAEKPAAAAPAASQSAQADDALRSEQAKVLAPPVKAPPPKAAPKDKEPAPKDKEAAQKEREAKERAAAAEARKKPPEKSEPAAEAKPADAKPADARPYVVQVAALADAEKAAEVQKAMSAKGLKVYTEKVKTSSGEVTRVRVGPFPNRDAAEKERARMKALGFDGSVLPR